MSQVSAAWQYARVGSNRTHWKDWIAVAITALTLVSIGLTTNYASAAVPGWLERRPYLPWAALGLLVVVQVLREIRAIRRDRDAALKVAAEQAAADEAAWLRSIARCVKIWPLQRFDQIDPFDSLGVASSLSQGPSSTEYVQRDVDRPAREHLRARGLLLIVGAPASGATRTAYETALAEPLARSALIPIAPDGLRQAVDDLDVLSRLADSDRLVLWLDDVDRFCPDGLSVRLLRELRERSPGLRVVATISSTRYPTWVTEERELSREFGTPVALERLLSPAELAQAAAIYPDFDFAEGVGPAFTALGSLLERLAGGDSHCPFEPAGGDCSMARAVVDVATGWAGTGTPRPLSADTLVMLAQQRMSRPGEPDKAHLDHVLKWAAAPVVAGLSLLSTTSLEGQELTVSANRDVADLRNDESVPSVDVWTAALDQAHKATDSEAVGRIGYHAHILQLSAVAAQAWALVSDIDEDGAAYIHLAIEFSAIRRDYAALIPLYERQLALAEASPTRVPLTVARLLTQLGHTWQEAGNSATARELLELALAIYEEEPGLHDVKVARTIGILGSTWIDSDAAKAQELLERSVAICEQQLGPDDLNVARTLMQLGNALLSAEEPLKARTILERALAIYEQDREPENSNLAPTLGSLGLAWLQSGNPAKARDLFERSLALFEQELGRHHLDLGPALDNLGTAWRELGDLAKARQFAERALAVYRKNLAPDHLKVARALGNLGVIRTLAGETTAARELLERTLAILERQLSADHLSVGTALADLGTGWLRADPGKARAFLERALPIFERKLGPNHLKVAATLTNLGTAWHLVGQPAKARKHLQRALLICTRVLGPKHPRTVMVAANLRRIDPDLAILSDGHALSPPPRSDG